MEYDEIINKYLGDASILPKLSVWWYLKTGKINGVFRYKLTQMMKEASDGGKLKTSTSSLDLHIVSNNEVAVCGTIDTKCGYRSFDGKCHDKGDSCKLKQTDC